MSDLFDEEPRDLRERSTSRRSRALIITAVVLVLGFFGLSTFAGVYTDRLWYVDGGYGSVFSTLLWTRVVLFLVFGALMAAVVGVNIWLAYRLRPFFVPAGPEQGGLDRYREAVTPIRTWVVVGVAALLMVFAGTSGAGQWRTYLLWRNQTSYGERDTFFNRDIGFYVFELPWLHFVVDFVMVASVLGLIAAAVVHYLYGGIRLQTPGDRLSGAAQAQLSVLLGVFVLAKAVDYWLDRYDLVHESGSLLTGITYTDDNAVLPAKNILAGIAVICAVLFFLNVWRRTWLLPSVGLALMALSAVLLGMIWPGVVEQFQVRPSQPDKEREYIGSHISATRGAYDLEDVEMWRFSGDTGGGEPTTGPDPQTTSSVPLVDPQLVQRTFEQNQQVRAYYSVADVLDVDRYVINEIERALVLGVRELDQSGINPNDRNWSNLHTVYTHGNGVIAAYANQLNAQNRAPAGTEEDKTQWAEGNSAGQIDLSRAVGGYESRIYFGEQSPDYSVVGKPSEGSPDIELDLQRATAPATDGEDGEAAPAEGRTGTTTYDGAGGVPVGSSFRQLMYAIRFGEPNFLLSGRVHENSQVLYHRNPRERVQRVAPWLTLEDDIYPAIVDGRILWIVDGYTTTDKYPGSELESFEEMTDDSLQEQVGLRTLPTDEINYMRNAVKATVDAYDGTVTLYAWDESDPLLKAWRGAFPGTVQPRSEIPEALLQHLRYPEDLFKVQRYQFARYHVEDPFDWIQGNDRWEVPEDPNQDNTLQPAYRMFVRQPSNLEPLEEGAEVQAPTQDPTWSLTSTFVPFGRSNLAAYVSVDSDATSETYGTMRVINVNDDQTQGPGQVANEFNSNSRVADLLAEFNRSGAQVTHGNLLTVPVGDGLMYVQPVYAVRAAQTASYPILRYVLVSYDGEVGIGTSLAAAIGDALGVAVEEPVVEPGGEPGAEPEPPTGTVEEQIASELAAAQTAFEEADQALSSGDLATYQERIEEAQGHVNRALELAGQRDAASPSPSPSPSE